MKNLVVGIALFASASAVHAGFITLDTVAPVAGSVSIAGNNDFKTILAGEGITTYTLGASLGVDEAGSVTYYYYGKEAGYRNDFLTGSLSYSSGFTPNTQNYFAAPIEIGTVDVGAGILDFSFCAYSSATTNIGCVSNAQNDTHGWSSFQSIALNVSDGIAWLFWDDSGAGPDDNHDDMLIKAEFRPHSVPEPGTLALLGAGLIGLGLSRRFRKQKN